MVSADCAVFSCRILANHTRLDGKTSAAPFPPLGVLHAAALHESLNGRGTPLTAITWWASDPEAAREANDLPSGLSAKPTSCRIVGDKPLADAALAVDGGFGSWGSFIAGRKMAAAQIDITGDSPRGIGSGRSTAGALSSDISTSGLRFVSLTYRSKAGSGCWRDGSRST